MLSNITQEIIDDLCMICVCYCMSIMVSVFLVGLCIYVFNNNSKFNDQTLIIITIMSVVTISAIFLFALYFIYCHKYKPQKNLDKKSIKTDISQILID
mgnify:CR=1 FL=1